MKYVLIFLSAFIFTNANAQNKKNADPKVFWQENFNSDKLPEGWYILEVGKWDPQWIVTNQPYPGSYKF